MSVKHKPTNIIHSGHKGGTTGCGKNTNLVPNDWAISGEKINCSGNGCK